MSGPLADRSNMNMRSSSIVTFNEAKAAAKAEKEKKPKGLNVVPSFSVMSSGMPQEVIAEELIKKGSKKKPVGGQTIDTFFKSITHLHFGAMRIVGDVEPLRLCANLRVLYVYENRLTSLKGIGSLRRLKPAKGEGAPPRDGRHQRAILPPRHAPPPAAAHCGVLRPRGHREGELEAQPAQSDAIHHTTRRCGGVGRARPPPDSRTQQPELALSAEAPQ